MSGAVRPDDLSAIAERARARRDEQRAIEERLRIAAPSRDAEVSRIAAALEAQAERESPRVGESPPVRARSRRLVLLAGALTPIAAAAAIVLALRAAPDVDANGAGASPDYVVSITGHVDVARAGGDASYAWLEATPNSLQQVIVRPRVPVRTSLAASVWIVRQRTVSKAALPTEISESGVVRFEVPGALMVNASEVRVAIAPPAHLAAAEERASRASVGGASTSDVVVVRVPVGSPDPPPRAR